MYGTHWPPLTTKLHFLVSHSNETCMQQTLVRVPWVLFVFEDKFCSVQKQLQKYLLFSPFCLSLSLSAIPKLVCTFSWANLWTKENYINDKRQRIKQKPKKKNSRKKYRIFTIHIVKSVVWIETGNFNLSRNGRMILKEKRNVHSTALTEL